MKSKAKGKAQRNSLESQTRNCKYPGCENTILDSNDTGMCEVCRALSVRNAITITLDPQSPFGDRRDIIFHTMLHNMSTDEKITLVTKMEWAYMELRRTLNSHDLLMYRESRSARDLETADIAKKSHDRKAPKTAKKKEKRIDKLTKLIGEDGAKEFEDFSF